MKHIKSLLIAALLGASFTSCNDFLNLDPLNDIVLENFWTNEADVESVLLGAYSALESSDCVQRMIVWGEMRSDNVSEGSGASDDIRQILRENLLTTNSFCKYNAFYNVINRANTVLYFSPIVAEKDPNYLVDEVLAHKAEAIALRCLSYWYLIRAFHDVPYVTDPSIDDEGGYQKFYVPQSSFEDILDKLINDLDSVKMRANNKYSTDDANVCRITRSAINAMLADMYLWRGAEGDLDKCIACCNEITAQKLLDYDKIRQKNSTRSSLALFNGYPLISDAPSTTGGNAYNEIFGDNYSFESIFELPFNNDVKNPFVGSYYMSGRTFQSDNGIGQLKAYEKIGSSYGGIDDIYQQGTDSRYYQNILKRGTGSNYAITKYAYSSVSYDLSNGSLTASKSGAGSIPNDIVSNYVVYRYSEVLLFEAEAYMLKAKALNPSGDDSIATLGIQNQYIDKAFKLIDAVNQRAIIADNSSAGATTLSTQYEYAKKGMSVATLETLLFKERRRELMFEGKRWFDLVRMARRDGNQDALLRYVEVKHESSTLAAVKIRLKNPYAMYFPMAKDEVRNSQGVLKQNPAYRDEDQNEQASH